MILGIEDVKTGCTPIVSPSELLHSYPPSQQSLATIACGRKNSSQILAGIDKRFLVIVGPCSIHDIDSAFEYASRLNTLRKIVDDRIVLIMRLFLEKPRTKVGWRGLINDPYLDGSCAIQDGLFIGRKLLLKITEIGIPVATEMLDPLVSNYTSDLVSWSVIGARTSESQTHRMLASYLPMPVGFKNCTSGDMHSAVNAIKAASVSSSFLGVDQKGRVAAIESSGNPNGHLILRGGDHGPNYDIETVEIARKLLLQENITSGILVDCSHMNSNRNYRQQENVWNEIVQRRLNGETIIRGIMAESFLHEGNQDINSSNLRYGVSVTDGCMGWDKTEELIMKTYSLLKRNSVK